MRSVRDRIRHALSFEILALMIVIPLGSVLFHMPMQDIGVIGVVSALIAMAWNAVYNYLFDLGMTRLTGNTRKTAVIRVVHAVLFEAGLLVMLLPLIAWYLGISLLQAFVMDISIALFYMGYALVFNWAYDRIFPLPEWSQAPVSH